MSRLVIIDRDGTLVEEKNYLSSPADLVLVRRAGDALRLLREAGLSPVVVTNQSAIGRGYFDLSTLERIHERLDDLLAAEDAKVDAVYVCPHVPDEGCPCRKPAPGLAERAAREFDAQLRDAFVIGDKECDIEMGKGIGATTILVRTGYGSVVDERNPKLADYVVNDLYDAACLIAQLLTAAGDTN